MNSILRHLSADNTVMIWVAAGSDVRPRVRAPPPAVPYPLYILRLLLWNWVIINSNPVHTERERETAADFAFTSRTCWPLIQDPSNSRHHDTRLSFPPPLPPHNTNQTVLLTPLITSVCFIVVQLALMSRDWETAVVPPFILQSRLFSFNLTMAEMFSKV